MIVFITVGILVVLTFLFFHHWISAQKPYKFPPGPKGLPFLGSIFDISLDDAEVDFTILSKQYGEIFSVKMAGQRNVVLNSVDAIREAFVSEKTRDAFAGRPDNFFVRYCDKGNSTVFTDYGETWRRQRQFLIKSLKIFDDGHHTIENIIREELNIVARNIKCTKGQPFNINDFLIPSLVNILLIMIAGKRFDYDHPAVQAAIDCGDMNAKIQAGHAMNVLTKFPFLRLLPFGYGKLYRKQQQCQQKFLHYAYEIPKKTFNLSVTRGFVDNLFRIQQDSPWLKEDNIRGMVRETIAAGLTTTRATLQAFFLIILHQPEVMAKIQEEIDSVIGRNRPPVVGDRGHLPYTEAATMELHRYVTVAPLSIPHSTTRDVEFRGYILPKKTLVFANLWAAHHDENVWGDPWVYRPERFLTEEGKLLPVDHESKRNWLAFGVGRRACLAETFARSRVFLIITTLLQQFDFRPCADQPLPSHDPRGYDKGLSVLAPPFQMIAIPRKTIETRL